MSDVDPTPLPSVDEARALHMARGQSLYASFREGVGTVIGAVLIALLLRSFCFEPFNIPSESMLPRLLVGDYLFVSKSPYGYSRYSLPLGLPLIEGRIFEALPERGDIVVFKAPRDNRTDYIKRVVGLPGDRIQMKGGVLFLNGHAVRKQRITDFVGRVTPNMTCPLSQSSFDANGERVCRYPRYRETLPGGRSYDVLDVTQGGRGDDTGIYVVPDGHFFAMGDNRDNSEDSRFALAEGGIGYVPTENLVGRASLMFFSTDGSASLFLPWTWFSAARWDRIGRHF